MSMPVRLVRKAQRSFDGSCKKDVFSRIGVWDKQGRFIAHQALQIDYGMANTANYRSWMIRNTDNKCPRSLGVLLTPPVCLLGRAVAGYCRAHVGVRRALGRIPDSKRRCERNGNSCSRETPFGLLKARSAVQTALRTQ